MTAPAGRLADRVAVVTGAGQGIGRAVAVALAQQGAAVLLLGRTLHKVETVVDEITRAGGVAVAVRCDVANRADVDAAIARGVERFGRIDIVINNAQGGAFTTGSPTAEISDEEILECFHTGPIGALHVMQACFDQLSRSGNGVVINFGSGVAVRGAPKMAAYAMAKEALGGLSKVAALEWGRFGIRVNVVCPSAFSPAALDYRDKHPAAWEKLLKETPLRRMGDPDRDVARAVMSLVTDDFSYLTGATLMLDGGKVIMR